MENETRRSKGVLIVLTLFFWWIGADRFYMGKHGSAILKVITFGGLGWWALYDWFLVFTDRMKDENGNTAK